MVARGQLALARASRERLIQGVVAAAVLMLLPELAAAAEQAALA